MKSSLVFCLPFKKYLRAGGGRKDAIEIPGIVFNREHRTTIRDIFFQLHPVTAETVRSLFSLFLSLWLLESGRILSNSRDKLLFQHEPQPEREYRSSTSATSTTSTTQELFSSRVESLFRPRLKCQGSK